MKHVLRCKSVLALMVLALFGIAANAASFSDVQANQPQISNDATSDTTAVFPTNKQNEPTVAVNPTNSDMLLAGANDEQRQPPCGPGPVRGSVPAKDCSFFPNIGTSGIYRSLDGGATWTNLGLLDDQVNWIASDLVSDGDPVIAYGPKPNGSGGFTYANGARAYYATLASFKDGRSPYPPNKSPELLAVTYSDDNGVTWSAPVIATIKENPNNFNDKEWIAVDNHAGSPYFGRLYLSWTQFRSATSAGNGSEPVLVSLSPDGGQSFSKPHQLSPAGNNGTGNGRQGSMVATGPDGSVYVVWEQANAQVVSSSRDGGKSWSKESIVGTVTEIENPIPGANFRTNSFPSIAADPRTGSSSIYVAWVNRTPAGGRVVISTSSNKGQTWSAAQTVSTAPEGYAFLQGLSVAPNGRLDVGYQALRSINPNTFGTGNATIDAWYVTKPAAGTWSAPLKVSSVSSDPAASAQNNLARQFWGDYNSMVSTNSHAYFIHTDSRNGAGCPAVDQYQQIISGTPAVRGDMADRIAERLGQNPYLHEPGSKPAPPEHCTGQFGNTDAYVTRIAP